MKNDFFDANSNVSNENAIPSSNNETSIANNNLNDVGVGETTANNEMGVNNNFIAENNNSISSDLNNAAAVGGGENNTDKPKSKKKLFIIIGVIVGVVVLAIIATVVYINYNFTAPKYIEEKIEEFSSFVDNMFAGYNYDPETDSVTSGDFQINTNMEELSMFNDTTFNFDFSFSSTKEIMDLNLELLKENDSLLNAEMYIDEANMYLVSEDLYPDALYSSLESNPFASIDTSGLQTIMDMQSFLKNFAKYLGTAIEETNVTTKISGLTAIYTYRVDDSNKEAFANKLNELIEEYADMVAFLETLNISTPIIDASTIADFSLEVVVKIPSGDLKSFDFTTSDLVISLDEVSKNNYDLKVNEEVIDVTVNGDDVRLYYENTEGTFDITYNTKDYTFKGIIEVTGYTFNLSVSNASDNVKNIAFDFESDLNDSEVSMNVDITTTNVSDTQKDTVGTISLVANGVSLNLDVNLSSNIGSDLVSEKKFNDAKDVNTLTVNDQNTIINNINDIFEKLGLENLLSSGSSEEQFLLTSQEVVNVASLYFTSQSLQGNEVTCVTIEDLVNFGLLQLDTIAYFGKVNMIDNNYVLSLTDGTNMIIDSSNITTDSISVFDSTVFSSNYYTCY